MSMFFKYILYVFSLIWAYSFIKMQNVFSKKTGIIFTLFVSKISWLTFIVAAYYGFKNFSFYYFIGGIIISIFLVQIVFWQISLFFNKKIVDSKISLPMGKSLVLDQKKLLKIKTFFEYLIILIIIKYLVF